MRLYGKPASKIEIAQEVAKLLLGNERLKKEPQNVSEVCRTLGFNSRQTIYNYIAIAEKKNFLKVEVSVPNIVPSLREKLGESKAYTGIKEWREADFLYHHRVAIDKNLRVGKWYQATFENQKCINIEESSRTDTPPLKLVAYDIETDNDRTRDPNPDYETITMVALYAGPEFENRVIVNAEKINY